MSKYRVLSSTSKKPTAWIVEEKNLSHSKALRHAKKVRGWYWGATVNSHHKKVGSTWNKVPQKYKESGDLYLLYAHITKM